MLPGHLLLSLVIGLEQASPALADVVRQTIGKGEGIGVGASAEAHADTNTTTEDSGADAEAHKTKPIGKPGHLFHGSKPVHVPFAHSIVDFLNKHLHLGLSAAAEVVDEAPYNELGAQGQVCLFCWCFEAAAGEAEGGVKGKNWLAAMVKSDARIWFDRENPIVSRTKKDSVVV